MTDLEEPVTQTSLNGSGRDGSVVAIACPGDDEGIAEAISKLTKEEAIQLLAYLETTYGI